MLTDLFPPGPPPLHPSIGTGPGQVNFASLITSRGWDPNDTTTDTTKPQGVGNVVAAALLNFRHHDGSNQLGDEPARTTPDPSKRYANYVPYTAVNGWGDNNVTDVWQTREQFEQSRERRLDLLASNWECPSRRSSSSTLPPS